MGFDRLAVGDKASMDISYYAHYLHHKYFEVNYADGMLPIDKWIGTWHDGTKAGDSIMQERFKKKRDRMNAALKDSQSGSAAQ